MKVKIIAEIPHEELVKAVREVLAERGISFQQENEWMNATDAMKYLGVSKRKFYEWLKKGLIPYSMMDGVKRYSKLELTRAMKKKQF